MTDQWTIYLLPPVALTAQGLPAFVSAQTPRRAGTPGAGQNLNGWPHWGARFFRDRTSSVDHIRGVLKTFGLLPGAMRGLPFDRRVEAFLADRSDVAPVVQPMLVAWRHLREQITVFDKAVRVLVKASPVCRLLMSVPGIGVSVLAYVSTVEDPARFRRSRSVGAHCGLTPRQYQSGEVDRSGRISKCGDILTRTLLYEAAVVILARIKRASALKEWAEAIARRSGHGKARVALARKLSVILHSIWRSGEPFRWPEDPATT